MYVRNIPSTHEVDFDGRMREGLFEAGGHGVCSLGFVRLRTETEKSSFRYFFSEGSILLICAKADPLDVGKIECS